jgi:CRP/FNR family transcriptional regulator/CRP/FNR family cyclic AMP-dependent transcriptional regulator
MMGEKIVDILAKVAVFQGLTRDDLKLFANKSRKLSFQERDILIQERNLESALYILIKGKLKVFLPLEMEGKKEHRVTQVSLDFLKEGNCFGEYSLIDHKPVSASIMATEPGELIQLQGTDFHEIVGKDDRIARTVYENMLRILIKRLRRKDQELDLIRFIG